MWKYFTDSFLFFENLTPTGSAMPPKKRAKKKVVARGKWRRRKDSGPTTSLDHEPPGAKWRKVSFIIYIKYGVCLPFPPPLQSDAPGGAHCCEI